MPNNFSPIAFSLSFLGISVGFTFVGLPLILLAFGLYWIISLFDIGTRVYLERKKQNISSEGFGHGILTRVSKSILMLTVILIFAHLRNYFATSDSVVSYMTAVIPAGIVGLFLVEELISLVENSIEISGEDSKVLKSLRKILGLGLDQGLSFAEKKAEKLNSNSADS